MHLGEQCTIIPHVTELVVLQTEATVLIQVIRFVCGRVYRSVVCVTTISGLGCQDWTIHGQDWCISNRATPNISPFAADGTFATVCRVLRSALAINEV